jgi:hypothetical protein
MGLPLLLALVAGCVLTGESETTSRTPPPPCPAPCHVMTKWENHVEFVPDPYHNGVPGPGLVARIYLFGPEIGHPVVGDGELEVLLIDETPGNKVPREGWRFDAKTLKRLLKRDFLGWGYTVFLPWEHYSPQVTAVLMKVGFKPAGGAPLFSESHVTLSDENGVILPGTTGPLAGPTGKPPPSPPGPPLPTTGGTVIGPRIPVGGTLTPRETTPTFPQGARPQG